MPPQMAAINVFICLVQLCILIPRIVRISLIKYIGLWDSIQFTLRAEQTCKQSSYVGLP